MTYPTIRVRLDSVDRALRDTDWTESKSEIHAIFLQITDTQTQESAHRPIYLYSIDPHVQAFIAGMPIGEEFDLVLMPVQREED